jgi:hypothetical protein
MATGRLTESDFRRMSDDDPRKQSWNKVQKKYGEQGRHHDKKKDMEAARARAGGSSPESTEASRSVGIAAAENTERRSTAKDLAAGHRGAQQVKSREAADRRNVRRTEIDNSRFERGNQRRYEDTKSALEGQTAGRVQGRTAQAAEGRGRGGYGRHGELLGGDPRQMRDRGRGGVSSNPFRRGGRGGSRGMVDQATVDNIGSHVSDQINKQNQAKGGPTFKHKSSGPVSKEKLDAFADHMKVQMDKANKTNTTRQSWPPPPRKVPQKTKTTGLSSDQERRNLLTGGASQSPHEILQSKYGGLQTQKTKAPGLSSDQERRNLLTGGASQSSDYDRGKSFISDYVSGYRR